MEFLTALFCVGIGGLLALALPAAWVWGHLRLMRRIEDLEARQSSLEGELAAARRAGVLQAATNVAPAVTPAPAPEVAAAPSPEPPASSLAPPDISPPAEQGPAPEPASTPEPPPPEQAPPAAPKPPPRPAFRPEIIGVWALAIPGGLALLLAAIFALREAIAAGLVGPGVRFALGAGVGAFALFASEIARWRRYDIPAAALGGGGAGIFYAVLYAGHARYGLIGQETAFALMTITTLVTLLAAERRDSRFMATLALFGGYLTPILLSTGENKAVAYFGYLALLDAGLLVAAVRRQWTTLILLSAVVTAALYVGWVVSFYGPDQVGVGLAAAALLGTLYVVVPGRRTTASPEALVGALGAGLLYLCGAIYTFPAQLSRLDPVSMMQLPRGPGDGMVFAALYTVVIPLVYALVGLRREGGSGTALQVVAASLGAVLLAVFSVGWSYLDQPAWLAVGLVLAAAPAFAALLGLLTPRASMWPVWAVTSGLLLAIVGVQEGAPIALLGVAALLAWLFAVLSAARGPRFILVLGLGAASLPLWTPLVGESAPEDAGPWFLASALVYAAFAFPPFWRPKQGDLFGALSAALVGTVLFLPFRRLWLDTLGDGVIGVLPILLGVVALFGAFALVRAVRVRADDRELAILVTVVLLFAALAVPLQLSEAWLTVGWAIEVALLAALSRRLTHPIVKGFAGLLAAIVCVRLLLNPAALDYGGGEGLILLNWTLYTWGVPAVCLLVAAALLRDPAWFRTSLRTAAVFLFFALINLEIAHAFAHDDVLSFTSERLGESMTRSVSWGSYGLLLIAVGTIRDSKGARLAGLFFALLGAFKIFVVDIWSLSGFFRVGSFAGLAITLLIGAIAFQRIVLRDRKP